MILILHLIFMLDCVTPLGRPSSDFMTSFSLNKIWSSPSLWPLLPRIHFLPHSIAATLAASIVLEGSAFSPYAWNTLYPEAITLTLRRLYSNTSVSQWRFPWASCVNFHPSVQHFPPFACSIFLLSTLHHLSHCAFTCFVYYLCHYHCHLHLPLHTLIEDHWLRQGFVCFIHCCDASIGKWPVTGTWPITGMCSVNIW